MHTELPDTILSPQPLFKHEQPTTYKKKKKNHLQKFSIEKDTIKTNKGLEDTGPVEGKEKY